MPCNNNILREFKENIKKELMALISVRHLFSWHKSKFEFQMRQALQNSIHSQIKMIRLINTLLSSEKIVKIDEEK